jgi:hypothetical protein
MVRMFEPGGAGRSGDGTRQQAPGVRLAALGPPGNPHTLPLR